MSRFYRKIGSWLGLLAILMATLAPTISQTLAARDNDDAMSGEHCAMDSMDSMPAMSSMHDEASAEAASAPPNASPNDAPTKHTQLTDGDACGYCSLLAHLPVVPGVETLFVVAVRAGQHIIATRFDSVRRVEPLTFAQPRAPPFSS